MADTPQDAETAAREALAELRTALSRVGITGSTVERMRAVPLAVDALEAVLALRPASSPGEVTEAMIEAACVAAFSELPPKDGFIWNRMRLTLEAALTAALLSATQTEAE